MALTNSVLLAYKVLGNQGQYLVPQFPAWATSERFDIQARPQGSPGKDEMRLMMRALLADRFKLAVHYETHDLPVFAYVLAKPGKPGPQLQPHPADAPCPTRRRQPLLPPRRPRRHKPWPAVSRRCAMASPACDPSVPGRVRLGGRNVTISFLADSLSAASQLDRLKIDQTGLTRTFDFTLEYTPELRGPLPPGSDFQPDSSGPSFEEALQEQLGIKLKSEKGPVKVLVLDHVEHPSENQAGRSLSRRPACQPLKW